MAVDEIETKSRSKGTTPSSIGHIIRQLMLHSQLSEADLCRGVNLPQTTINRLLSGQTNDPRMSTVVSVARFFGVSIGQLLGQEMLVLNKAWRQARGATLPLVDWDSLDVWLRFPSQENEKIGNWVKTERSLKENAFAVRAPVSCFPIFGCESLLIMDRYEKECGKDGQIALVELPEKQFCLRKILKEGNSLFLQRLFEPFQVTETPDEVSFHAFVVEVRNDHFSV